jgi:hypothetical protein
LTKWCLDDSEPVPEVEDNGASLLPPASSVSGLAEDQPQEGAVSGGTLGAASASGALVGGQGEGRGALRGDTGGGYGETDGSYGATDGGYGGVEGGYGGAESGYGEAESRYGGVESGLDDLSFLGLPELPAATAPQVPPGSGGPLASSSVLLRRGGSPARAGGAVLRSAKVSAGFKQSCILEHL